ncbi:hypothetical protein K1T71_007447 [Dendrolimus kikuchii]|uniref:Uncharacterized protein n=1 Tax=Dendrolimus kikuchii TaxID=765133 RepID=A0ACC1D0M8_9NEOP|nr:hypothetical protein K1T71_007447 [Dendrolimus kikuchii]
MALQSRFFTSLTNTYVVINNMSFIVLLPRRQNKLVGKRCTGCYAKLKAQGVQAIRAKQVYTQCKQCQKAFCLDCFNQKPVD